MRPLGNPRKVWGSWDVKSTKLFVFGWKNSQSWEKKATNKRFFEKERQGDVRFWKKTICFERKVEFFAIIQS